MGLGQKGAVDNGKFNRRNPLRSKLRDWILDQKNKIKTKQAIKGFSESYNEEKRPME